MPLLGSSAYGTVGQVTSLIRSLVNDIPGNWATDTVLLPYVNSVYRSTQKKIANAGGAGFVQDNTLLVVTAVAAALQVPGTQVVINDATAPPNQLPSNLLVPLNIKERPNLSTQEFVQMTDMTEHGGLPSLQPAAQLLYWEWRSDGIYFIGATKDVQIRLRYLAAFPDLAGPGDVILIRGAVESLAYGAAALVGFARGSPLADKMEALFSDVIEDVLQENIQRQQHSPVRRRPFRARQRNWGRRGNY